MFILNCSTCMWLHIYPCYMRAHVRVHGGDETVCGKVSPAASVSHLHKVSSFKSHLKTFFGDGVFMCRLCVEVGDLTGAGLGLGSHCLCMTVL